MFRPTATSILLYSCFTFRNLPLTASFHVPCSRVPSSLRSSLCVPRPCVVSSVSSMMNNGLPNSHRFLAAQKEDRQESIDNNDSDNKDLKNHQTFSENTNLPAPPPPSFALSSSDNQEPEHHKFVAHAGGRAAKKPEPLTRRELRHARRHSSASTPDPLLPVSPRRPVWWKSRRMVPLATAAAIATGLLLLVSSWLRSAVASSNLVFYQSSVVEHRVYNRETGRVDRSRQETIRTNRQDLLLPRSQQEPKRMTTYDDWMDQQRLFENVEQESERLFEETLQMLKQM